MSMAARRAPQTATPMPAAASHYKIGYAFWPLPMDTIDLVRDGTIDSKAVIVLVAILRWRKDRAGSCWCTNRTLCKQTGFSEATIHRALRQLRTAKMVERIAVPAPDPLDPRNHTGYRFKLLFTASSGVSPVT